MIEKGNGVEHLSCILRRDDFSKTLIWEIFQGSRNKMMEGLGEEIHMKHK